MATNSGFRAFLKKKIMRYFLLLLLPLLIGCSKLQTIEESDAEGYRTVYNQNKETGLWEGSLERYTPNATLIESATYENGVLQGERRLFREDGSLETIERYVDGKFEGAFETFYPGGEAQLYGVYQNDVLAGPVVRYYESGDTMEVVQFENNQESGPFIEYYDGGNLKAKGFYREGDNEDGPLELYDESGELERRMNCNMGICRTVWLRDSVMTVVE